MNIDFDDMDAVGTKGGDKWYASRGINEDGRPTVVNYCVKDEDEVSAVAHGLGIAYGLSMHEKARYIGTKADYEDM